MAEIAALPAKPLKAYCVSEEHEGTGGIVFAHHNAVARRHGACEFGDGDWESVTCRRAPEFDQYAPGPVPDYALSDNGWYLWCKCGCDRKIEAGRLVIHEAYDEEHGRIYELDRETEAWLDKRNGSLWCDRWGPMRRRERTARYGWGRTMARTMARLSLPEDCWFYLDENGKDDGNSRDGISIGHREFYGPPEPKPARNYFGAVMPGEPKRWRGPQMPRQDYDLFHCAFKFPGAQYWATWQSDNPAHPWVCQGDLFAYYLWCGKDEDWAILTAAKQGISVTEDDIARVYADQALRKAA